MTSARRARERERPRAAQAPSAAPQSVPGGLSNAGLSRRLAREPPAQAPAGAAQAPATSWVVDAGEQPGSGQLTVPQFLATLQERSTAAAREELGVRAAIVDVDGEIRTFLAPYHGRNARDLEQAIRQQVPEAAGAANADAVIARVTDRVRQAARAQLAAAPAKDDGRGSVQQVKDAVKTGVQAVGNAIDAGKDKLKSAWSSLFSARPGTTGGPKPIGDLGPGRPLDHGVRGRMEPVLGDLGNVRLHDTPQAHAETDRHNARAVAIGNSIAFGPGQYQPGTLAGDALIAHELAHTQQQQDAAATSHGVGELEHDADAAARDALLSLHAGAAPRRLPRLRTATSLQRCSKADSPAPQVGPVSPTLGPPTYPTTGDGKLDTDPAPAADAGGQAVTVDPPPPGEPHKLTPTEETAYAARAKAALDKLGTAAAKPDAGGGGGHTAKGAVPGFPEWFSTLQDNLIDRATWGADEEAAQHVLADYALARFAAPSGDTSKVPGAVKTYCKYLGRSKRNLEAAAKAGLPNAGQVGGAVSTGDWCAAAGSSAIQLALESVGVQRPDNAWLMSKPGVKRVWFPAAAVDALISPGDQVEYVSAGTPMVGGHTVTAVTSSQGAGTTFEHASGNAGGGGGSVRLGAGLPREMPPKTVTGDDFLHTKPSAMTPPAPTDKFWVYTVTKMSTVWDELNAVLAADPSDPWNSALGKAFLAKYKLKAKGTP